MLCGVAYLQAFATIFPGRVHYVGVTPDTSDLTHLNLASITPAFPRNIWRKATDFLSMRAVDRLSPVADRWLRSRKGQDLIVVVNGERAGRYCRTANYLGFKSIFLPHNYAYDYLAADKNRAGLKGSLYSQIYCSNAYQGCRWADLRVFLTSTDQRRYQERLGSLGLSMAGGYFSPCIEEAREGLHIPRRKQVCINANLELEQNQKGIAGFLSNVWPIVVKEKPDVRLVVAGLRPPRWLKDLASSMENCQVIDSPSAEEMEIVFSESMVCVATTVGGSGIKIRVGEALKRGKAVLSTPDCAIGYEAVTGEVLRVYRNDQEAASELSALLSRDAGGLSAHAREAYRQEYGFEAGCRRLSGVLGRIN